MIKLFLGVLAITVSCHLPAAEYFLEETEPALLEPHPTVPGVMRHIAKDADLGSHHNILFGSVTMYFAESSKSKDINADEAMAISNAMKAALAKAGEAVASAELVQQPGPGTALLNVAITEISTANNKRGLFGYTPMGLLVTTAGDLAGMRMQLKDAKIEGEVVDSVTGKVLTVFRVNEIQVQEDEDHISWSDVTSVFEAILGQTLQAEKN